MAYWSHNLYLIIYFSYFFPSTFIFFVRCWQMNDIMLPSVFVSISLWRVGRTHINTQTRSEMLLLYLSFLQPANCGFISFINGKQSVKIKRLNRNQSCCYRCCYIIQLNWFHENRPQIKKQTKQAVQSKLVRDVTWNEKNINAEEQGKSPLSDVPSWLLWLFAMCASSCSACKNPKIERKNPQPNESKDGYINCVFVYSVIFNRTRIQFFG